MTMTRYTTWGRTRGCCGHLHETFDEAFSCLRHDIMVCSRRGGYSDREVRRIAGDSLAEIQEAFASYDVTRGPGKRE